MVKVLIDGKEYEGKKVLISDYDETVLDTYDKKTKQEGRYFVSEESVQEFVSVPKEIQFISSRHKLALLINNHYLIWDSNTDNWEFESIYSGFNHTFVDCVLVPVKRSELKVGDWAVHFYRNIDDENLKEISNYRLVIGENKIVKVLNNSKINIVEESYGSNYGNWFKVVPRSDLK